MVFSPGGMGHLYLSSLQSSAYEKMIDIDKERSDERHDHVYRDEDLTDADGDTIIRVNPMSDGTKETADKILVIGKGGGKEGSPNSRQKVLSTPSLIPEPRKDLPLFVGITSGYKNHALRMAARQTWLTNCTSFNVTAYTAYTANSHNGSKSIGSPPTRCSYKFFVDKMVNSAKPSEKKLLEEEQELFGDIVFRDECSFMKSRHPYLGVHYGNVAHYDKNSTTNPDYQLRRMYKIDWKVCIFRWALDSQNLAQYFLLVEDDSYSCLGNIEHQISSIESSTHPVPLIRAGTPMFDGFDDSSTFMSGQIAAVFAKHYPSSQFDCSQIWTQSLEKQRLKYDWLSWGNSWMHNRCGWRQTLETKFHLPLVQPAIDCFTAKYIYDGDPSGNHPIYAYNYTQVSHVAATQLSFPCAFHPIIVHGARAAEMYLSEVNALRSGNLTDEIQNNPVIKYKSYHICEYVLTIDKIKDPNQLHDLHDIALNTDDTKSSSFRDLSLALTHEDHTGWMELLRNYEKEYNVSLSSVSADIIRHATQQNKIAYMGRGDTSKTTSAENKSSITSRNKISDRNHVKNDKQAEFGLKNQQLRSRISSVHDGKRRALMGQDETMLMDVDIYHYNKYKGRNSRISSVEHTNERESREELLEFAFFYHKMIG